MPKFLPPQCENCKFLGTYFDHDVYICVTNGDTLGGSIIARYGDDPWEYASSPSKLYLMNLSSEERTIGGEGMETMPYRDYVFSTYCNLAEKAMVLGLAIHQLKALIGKAEKKESDNNYEDSPMVGEPIR